MKTADIDKIIRTAFTDHMVRHVQVPKEEKRDRVELFIEQAVNALVSQFREGKDEDRAEMDYQQAKKIVDEYQAEAERRYDLQIEAFRRDLTEYFANNKIDGRFHLTAFELDKGSRYIHSGGVNMEENYEGGNDEDIQALCKKHGVKFKFPYYYFHK